MADNYLITGYHGEPHVTVENDRGFNAAVFGTGKFVLPVGQAFRAERVGSNTIRMYDGKLLDNGALAGIPAGEYIDFTIQEAGRSRNRYDVIIFEYSRNGSTLVESGVFKVISGAETTGDPVFPTLTENDLLTNMASFDQMALWVIYVSGSNIYDPEPCFWVSSNFESIYGEFIHNDAKGVTGGVATLDSSGKVPSSQLPSMNYIPTTQKGAASGVASLDSSGKVPSSQLPSMDYIPTSQKGAASGVAPLNASKKIDSTYLPSMDYIPTSQKGAASGVAPLNSSKKLTNDYIIQESGTGSINVDGTNVKSVRSQNVTWEKFGKIVFVRVSATFDALVTTSGSYGRVEFGINGIPSTVSSYAVCVSDVSVSSDSGSSYIGADAFVINSVKYGNRTYYTVKLSMMGSGTGSKVVSVDLMMVGLASS